MSRRMLNLFTRLNIREGRELEGNIYVYTVCLGEGMLKETEGAKCMSKKHWENRRDMLTHSRHRKWLLEVTPKCQTVWSP